MVRVLQFFFFWRSVGKMLHWTLILILSKIRKCVQKNESFSYSFPQHILCQNNIRYKI